ncbi:galactosylceramide sulfotransferase-like [Apostichopus japonicus]|uniref:galactosylceramide sulfotransferase-like n=1 Tax=Stichopus japonicus TaxID=307972 RepID=UPI003AB40ECD
MRKTTNFTFIIFSFTFCCLKRSQTLRINLHSEDNHCQPRNSIVLAKTHKTGGSTLGTIIARYGYGRNLTFALPSTGFILGYQTFSQEILLRQPTDEGFNVLVNHVPFHRANMEKVMKPTDQYVTILREPVSLREIKAIEEELDLVLIADYFDKSLLLLKKMMCWKFEDIMFIKKKQRRNVSREPTRIEQANAIRK